MTGHKMNFNQDFTSISVLSKNGFRLFSISSNDKVEEIFSKDNEQIRIVERLFNSSLVVLVTVEKPNCLKMLHFKKKQDICNCVYPTDILCVRMNRHRLIVCLAESIHIHDIRDMKILHSIVNIAPNELGLCTLSLNSYLAFPICSTTGELRIFNANKLRPGLSLRAHDTALSALNFSPNGLLLATASERGTVIRVFCVKSGQRIQEFRRGVKRCVRIASLVFSSTGDYLCASSNTETVHIFKMDASAVEAATHKSSTGKPTMHAESQEQSSKRSQAEPKNITDPVVKPKSGRGPQSTETSAATSVEAELTTATASTSSGGSSWSGYFSKAVSSYLIPSQFSDALAQDRAFATAALAQPGLRHVIGLAPIQKNVIGSASIQKQLQLLIACDDGFLYIHEFNAERGGVCKLLRMHDLRCPLEGVIELNLTESMDRVSLNGTPTVTTVTPAEIISTETSSTTTTTTRTTTTTDLIAKNSGSSVLIENPDLAPDNSYAGILKGKQTTHTLTADSAKFRKLCDAIDTPTKLYDERQFPPVAIAAKD